MARNATLLDQKTFHPEFNWQTRIALDWLTHDPEMAAYWRAVAASHEISAVTPKLTTTMVETVSELLASLAHDAAVKGHLSVISQ